MRIATLYVTFAIVAAITNFGSQWVVLATYAGEFRDWLALFVGTIVGLIVKYLLDKRWIFAFQSKSVKHEGKTFVIYTVFSVVTTVIFWGFEVGSLFVFGTQTAQFVGGAIGLGIGYVAKFQLDKRYTFTTQQGDGSDD